MKSFLEKLAEELSAKHGGDLSGLCLVFPTRRAGLYFRKVYAATLEAPAWAPAIFSIEDFVRKFSSLQPADDLDLVFEIYGVYRKYFPEESFSKFYPWGVMLLKDFDETDAALADGHQLFSSVAELRDIEEQFDLSDEDKERIYDFWNIYFDRKQGAIRKSFMENWRHLEAIYSEFNSLLRKKKMAYEGLAVRTVAEGLASGAMKSAFSHHVFAGFYSLTKAEEKIISFFLGNGTGSIYFDADNYYTGDEKQEAGTFIRKNALVKSSSGWKEDLLATDDKQIEMIGVPLQVLQAKTAGQIIHQLPHDPGTANRTAVVLPDEQLLLPLLYALPDHIEDINVTMGYPLSASPLFNVIESIFDLQKSLRNDSFYFRQVVALLSHPYVQFLDPAGINKWLTQFRAGPKIRIPVVELKGTKSEAVNILFTGFQDVPQAKEYFNRFFLLLIDAIRKNKDGIQSIEKEYVYYFYTRFKKLAEILDKHPEEISVDTFRSLFREVIRSTRIPFTGEPLRGLQVMGFLETRVLDFENVIILSLNEDVLPPSAHHPSFIPYSLRRAFGLPTFEEHNAIAAYHFYRLLQRAKKIYLIYNSEVRNFSSGEKSRFLLQVENELAKKNPRIRLTERHVPVGVREAEVPEVIITKTPEVMENLLRYFGPLTEPVKFARKFSASALASYIACPLRFYFQYVAKLKETEEPDETIEGSLLGTVLHEAMHSLYKPFQVVTAKDFEKLYELSGKAVDEAIRKEFGALESLEGKNLLMRNVLNELVKRILEFDRKNILSIRYLEEEFVMPVELEPGKQVHLYGIIDRVDEVDGILRVIDYKTGAPDTRRPKDIESMFRSPELKEHFQTFFYAMLLKKRTKSSAIKAGLFRLRKLSEGISWINEGQVISNEQFAEFFSHTRNLLTEIFNPEIPFTQTEDETRCRYCPYKDICNR